MLKPTRNTGAKNAYPFVTLEERIVCFMRDSNVFFTYPVRPQAEDSDSNADVRT